NGDDPGPPAARHRLPAIVDHRRPAAVRLVDSDRRIGRVAGGAGAPAGGARRAVVTSSHLARLPEMIDGAEPGDDLRAAQAAWRPGLSVFAVHAALSG